MLNVQLAVVFTLAIGYIVAPDPNSIDILKKIWQYKKAFQSCENEFNYGCRCSTMSVKTMTCDFKCISLDRRCNGFQDCPLGDDELDCPEPSCNKGNICCEDGSCATLCDGIPECLNETDEAYCEPPIGTHCVGKMLCPDGSCATVCDSDYECDVDAGCDLDERDCRFVCPFNYYVCDDTEAGCALRCNTNQECETGVDESKCYIECASDEVSCEIEPQNVVDACVELCSETLCQSSGWNENNQYCGTCHDCVTDCIKDTEGCP